METKQLTKIELEEIERQLSHPSGEKGIEIAALMHQSNIDMTRASIAALHIEDANVILEIGHGNCGHLNEVLSVAKELTYIGLEISKTMHIEAQKQLNEVTANAAIFKLYDGNVLPFKYNTVDRIMTVNTIYFWKNPKEFLLEVYRVLKPKGLFVIAFAHKDFMEKLPFVKTKFQLYSPKSIELLIKESPFKLKENQLKQEEVQSKSGEMVTRMYSVVVLEK